MNAASFWERQSFLHAADILIVGSGIVGLSCAIALKSARPDLGVSVVERGALPAGASTKNAGFACFGSMTEILDDLSSGNVEEVFQLVERRWRGLQALRSLTGDYALRFQQLGGFELFATQDQAAYETCMGRLQAFNEVMKELTGDPAVYSSADHLIPSFGFHSTSHLILNRLEGQLDTGQMMRTLLQLAASKGVVLLNGLDITQIAEENSGLRLLTSQGWQLSASLVLLATNGFAGRFFPELPIQPARNQVLITKPLERLPFRGAFHYDRGYVYFRNVDCPEYPGRQRILLGGARNLDAEAEATSEFGNTSLIQERLWSLLREVILPGHQAEVDYWWSGILGVGPVKKPIVQMMTPRLGVAVRLGGMGVAIGNLVGQEAATMLLTTSER
jgi:hypothetical protein